MTSARRWARRLIPLLAIAVAALTVRDQLPSPATIWSVIATADPTWIAVAFAAEWVSMAMFARQQQRLLKGVGIDVAMGRVLAVTYSRSAIAISMPAGTALSAGFAYQAFRRWGASREAATTVMILSGVLSFAALALLYLTGFLFTLGQAPMSTWHAHPVATIAALTAAVAVAVLLAWRRGRSRSNSPATPTVRSNRLATFLGGIIAAAATMAPRHRAAALAFAAANWLADMACLAAVTRAVHLPLAFFHLGTIYVVVQIVRQIPLTPGGMGVIEASLLSALVAAGADDASAAGAVIGYRLFSCWLIIAAGLAIWAFLRRTLRSHTDLAPPHDMPASPDRTLSATATTTGPSH
ncbi:hypothetical protein Rhe02_01780 [Rhizocola hellebori]|uniref:Uncharacterized protein n=1 Tax=Rhizocola hellebori TaxID=1392758 RepID=A0A8J3VD21_9ACTN|nr:YbhN family protein [Rhizocola hellebori]GIH02111.1 hypothetical protein Rhe02_01780 [Rhizocola hellebori]